MAHIFGDGSSGPFRIDLPDQLTGAGGSQVRIEGFNGYSTNSAIVRGRLRTPTGGAIDDVIVKFQRLLKDSRVDRFRNEIRIMTSLDHPRIAKVYDYGEVTTGKITVPWMAVERGGENLWRAVSPGNGLQPALIRALGLQMCEALGHIHSKGFIHRDIKPQNFVFDLHEPDSVLMIDFGIAKRVSEDVRARPLDQLTRMNEYVGPVFFSSPELIAYAEDKTVPVDERSDLFQLGRVLWYIATGEVGAGVPSRRKDPTGGALHDVVMELLPDDPDDRINSTPAVAERLRALPE